MTSRGAVPTVELNDGAAIPQLGIGVFLVSQEEAAGVVGHALETGYRHVDTAAAYRNERQVGEAVRASGLPRDEVWVTTKCWNTTQGYDEAKVALAKSLERLGLDHVDLYLIHWPAPALDRYLDTWKALIELRSEGLARSIGVSNFQPAHLRRIIDETGVVPAVNQIELHPYLQQQVLRREHAERGIVTEAWSPLARGGELLREDAVQEVARAHGRTPAQVVLRWQLQLGNVVFPKSANRERIEENFAIFDFELSDEQMGRIGSLERGERTGPDPDTFTGG